MSETTPTPPKSGCCCCCCCCDGLPGLLRAIADGLEGKR
jgi:hypothetical protein